MLACRKCPSAGHGINPRHRDQKDGQRQRRADPKPPLHLDQFRVRPLLGRRLHRLQRHPALRARSRPILDDLRVHRARVFARRRKLGRASRRGASISIVPRLPGWKRTAASRFDRRDQLLVRRSPWIDLNPARRCSKLTARLPTPATRLSPSTRATHPAQCIPRISSTTSFMGVNEL